MTNISFTYLAIKVSSFTPKLLTSRSNSDDELKFSIAFLIHFFTFYTEQVQPTSKVSSPPLALSAQIFDDLWARSFGAPSRQQMAWCTCVHGFTFTGLRNAVQIVHQRRRTDFWCWLYTTHFLLSCISSRTKKRCRHHSWTRFSLGCNRLFTLCKVGWVGLVTCDRLG